MIFYTICAMLGFILYPFFYRLKEEPLNGVNYKEKKMYFVLIAFVLILIGGLRKRNIGIDTSSYYYTFQSYKNISWSRLSLNIFDEPGYKILNWGIANILHGDFQGLLMIEAIIAIVPVAILIYRHSDVPPLSWFFYLAFGFYTFSFSTIRQAIALGFTVLAFLCIPKRKALTFHLLIFVAMLFHQTAIIVLPMYWLRYLKINAKNTFIFLVLGIVMYIFRSPIMAMLNEMSKNYYYAIETGGELQFVFIVLMILTGFLMAGNFRTNNPINSQLYFLLATTAAIFWVVKMNPAVLRLYFYFYIYVIIYIPNQIKSIKTQAMRTGFTVAYVLVGLYFFATQVLFPDLKIIEYEFFWQ
ncbi:MAG: EpsG family protein [Clostridia bacterium]|nr:EpsG family protein [Clostridia bacterium]